MTPSEHSPKEWKWVALFPATVGRNRFDVRLPLFAAKVGKLAFKAMGLPESTQDSALTLKAAIELGGKVEKWRAIQEGNARRTKR